MQPAAASAETMQNVGIDAIAYSETGAVELSGHGSASANVRIYIDNAPVITVLIGADGKWKLTLPDLHEGVYTLRADQIDAAGKVRTRIADTVVAFKPLSAAEIDAYIACGEGLGKAGGYAIQGRAEAFVRFLSGSHSGVIGLPLFETRALLQSAGYPVG